MRLSVFPEQKSYEECASSPISQGEIDGTELRVTRLRRRLFTQPTPQLATFLAIPAVMFVPVALLVNPSTHARAAEANAELLENVKEGLRKIDPASRLLRRLNACEQTPFDELESELDRIHSSYWRRFRMSSTNLEGCNELFHRLRIHHRSYMQSDDAIRIPLQKCLLKILSITYKISALKSIFPQRRFVDEISLLLRDIENDRLALWKRDTVDMILNVIGSILNAPRDPAYEERGVSLDLERAFNGHSQLADCRTAVSNMLAAAANA